jgi:hypothetical protein
MSSAPYRARRAAVDDLPALRALWASMRHPVADLERRLTEFQVVEDASGQVVGTLGFCIQLRNGLIHSEAFADFSAADELRPLFWTRIQSLVLNHGLAHLWTVEDSPFWTRNGFQVAAEPALQKLPPAWAAAGTKWFTLRIKDEDAISSVEKEIEVWMLTERQRMARQLEKAKTIKTVATAFGVGLAVLIVTAACYLWLARPHGGLMPH